MKKIFLVLIMVFSLNAIGQDPDNDCYETVLSANGEDYQIVAVECDPSNEPICYETNYYWGWNGWLPWLYSVQIEVPC